MALDWYIGSEWCEKNKGLHKRVLDIKFVEMKKPGFLANCTICIKEVKNLYDRQSKYLAEERIGQLQTVELLTAITPLDYYVELLLQTMLLGETAKCQISIAKPSEESIEFVVTLEKIEDSRDFHTLTSKEMYELVSRLKQNGLDMYKSYPKFSHAYFARAAKCLISYKPFKRLKGMKDDIESEKMTQLFKQLKTNLAANLLTLKRYEDVIYLTQFVDTNVSDVSEKAIYRRAVAYYKLKEYRKAQKLIEERVPGYQDAKEFAKLYQQILQDWKTSKQEYKNFVQRMFN